MAFFCVPRRGGAHVNSTPRTSTARRHRLTRSYGTRTSLRYSTPTAGSARGTNTRYRCTLNSKQVKPGPARACLVLSRTPPCTTRGGSSQDAARHPGAPSRAAGVGARGSSKGESGSMPLPLVLAGPILRRVEPNLVSVWLALSEQASIAITVWEGRTKAGAVDPLVHSDPPTSTLRFGERLHVATHYCAYPKRRRKHSSRASSTATTSRSPSARRSTRSGRWAC